VSHGVTRLARLIILESEDRDEHARVLLREAERATHLRKKNDVGIAARLRW
jgi:hypothetical protein